MYSHCDSKGIALELKLNELFGGKRGGFFIELGANDGLFQSNTAWLEKEKDWKGILIEPSIKGYQLCIQNRPNSICLNYACVGPDYHDSFVSGDFLDNHPMGSVGSNRLGKNHLTMVKAITLSKLLKQHPPSSIDLLSLDTEGYELNILQGMDFTQHRPHYMLIEIYNKDYSSIIHFLESHQYQLLSNFTNYNKIDNPHWDGSHNDYLFIDEWKKQN